ncbi:MAG: hypothetical protein ABI716_01745 [Candidatus Saccharibacteria bacterium]
MTIWNDQNISQLLQANNMWGQSYNHYFYGIKMPSVNMVGLVGVFAAVTMKLFIVNVSDTGLGIIGLNLMGDVEPTAIAHYDRQHIASMTVKTKWIALGMADSVEITFSDGDVLKLQVNKWNATVKQQGANLARLRRMQDPTT